VTGEVTDAWVRSKKTFTKTQRISIIFLRIEKVFPATDCHIFSPRGPEIDIEISWYPIVFLFQIFVENEKKRE